MVGFEAMDRREIRVVQGGEQARFALEAAAPVRILEKLSGQELDGDVAVEAEIARAIDLTHAPGAESTEDLVGTETRAGGERHGDEGILSSLDRRW